MLSEKIRSRMAELGISQAELARRSGLTTSHISYLVRGERGQRLDRNTVTRLCKGLDVKVNFFYEEDSHMGVEGISA